MSPRGAWKGSNVLVRFCESFFFEAVCRTQPQGPRDLLWVMRKAQKTQWNREPTCPTLKIVGLESRPVILPPGMQSLSDAARSSFPLWSPSTRE